MKNDIKHSGTVETIESNHIQVRIEQRAACAACKVASHCNASDMKVKLIDVWDSEAAASLKPGQEVTVTASRNTAGKALLIGFGLPFFVLIGVIVAVLALTGNELTAALSGLGALVPYYFGVWLLRDRIQKGISFRIE